MPTLPSHYHQWRTKGIAKTRYLWSLYRLVGSVIYPRSALSLIQDEVNFSSELRSKARQAESLMEELRYDLMEEINALKDVSVEEWS